MTYSNNIYSAACIMQYLVVCGLFDNLVNISDYLALFVEWLLNELERSWRRGRDLTDALSRNFPLGTEEDHVKLQSG
jgi:hypothetical protein